ncbi:MAG: helix-turn-helix domain-containing protein [Prevotellaceae bacterium]|jgi:transcriptional regulator with XRE-family HTH domain|nr:helix-turn-helix domain-containing protein [Prevotellaceae bacterium]
MKSIIEKIKEIRQQKAYSQEYMATRLQMEQVGYGLIENGKRKLKYETLEQIALIFEINVIDIITYPKKYIDADSLVFESNGTEKVTVMFEVSAKNRERLINIVLNDKLKN